MNDERLAAAKRGLRRAAATARDAVRNRADAAAAACAHLSALPPYRSAVVVLWYVNMPAELATGRAIEAALEEGKQVVVPWCDGEDLGLWRLESMDELEPGTWGIPEPPPGPPGRPGAPGRPGDDRSRRRPRPRLRRPGPPPRSRQGLLRSAARAHARGPGRALLRRAGVPAGSGRPPRRADGLAGHGTRGAAGRTAQRCVGMLKSACSRAPDGQRWVIVFSRV